MPPDVQFENQNYGSVRPAASRKSFAGMLVEKGIAKSEYEANIMLLGLSVLIFALALFIAFWGGSGGSNAPEPIQANPQEFAPGVPLGE